MRPVSTWLNLSLAVLFVTGLAAPGCGGGGDDDGGGDADAVLADAGGGDAGVDVGTPDLGGETGTEDALVAGAVVIVTEFHANPCAVSDGDGEWIELTNVTTEAVDIEGWTLTDETGDRKVIENGAPLLVEPGLSVVLAPSADTGVNGGVTVDYAYGGGFTLKNSGLDQIVLLDGSGAEVDRVAYDDTWPWGECAAFQLSSTAYTAADNDDPANWCPAVSPYGAGEDFGTPGGANAICVTDRCGDGTVDPT